MRQQEVLRELEKRGASIHPNTLRNWEKWGLIPTAKRRSGGRGVGKITEYPPDTPDVAYAVWWWLNHPIDAVKKLQELSAI